jgi:hypothetical protein
MNNGLTAYNENGLELFINNATGESYASMSATARLCVCEVTQIRRLTGDTESLKAFNIKTSNGDKDVKLLNEEQILKCLVKYNPEAILKFAQAGLRVYLHQIAGYQVTSSAVQTTIKQQPTLQQKLDTVAAIEKIPSLQISESLKQVLLDSIGDEFLTNKQLPEVTERWVGVAQLAEELGYKTNQSNRSSLGAYCAKASGLAKKREKRLCVGQLREIWVYLETDALKTVIHDYFALDRLSTKH